ncbi:MAG: HAMP domain-containing histidine kinase, partial [Kofleriaceae bacterium]|nr:HAMP domain-containing histidine kinase [Kofleriaceae bacterium]
FAVFGWVALEVTRRDLDAELGTRLTAVAAAASTQLRGKYLLELGPGNEDDRGYQGAVKKLQAIEAASGVTLFVFDRAFAVRADTVGSAIGTPRYEAQLDRIEVAAVFDRGSTAASVTFVGKDGVTYKTGYAPVHASDTDAKVVLVIGAQAPATYFLRLRELRANLLYWGLALVSVVLLTTAVMTVRITGHVRRLALAAERMKTGDLSQAVEVTSRDEIGVLGETMDEMRVALRQRDTELQAMLAGIAHEVRNPLAGMTLYASILRDELPADDERAGYVAKIERELGYLDRVVTDFLDYARRPPIERSVVRVAELLAEVAPLVAIENCAVSVDCAATLEVFADRGQLRRALLNLAHNAVQASAAGAVVQITAGSEPSIVWIAVANTGEAITPEVAARLFEPFFTTRQKGTGLGLAFVRDIARAHRGEVVMERVGTQTRFVLRLPRGIAHGKA